MHDGPVLGIFTVKRLALHDGTYWTYGGFGRYLTSMLANFRRVVLAAHVASGPPGAGHYAISHPNLEVVHLPATRGEAAALLSIPAMRRAASTVVKAADVVHARVPDYTGVVGARAADRAGVPCFVSVIDDWAVQAKATPVTKKGGLGLLLRAHLSLYDWFERRACADHLVFAQGASAYEKHRRSSDCRLVLSSAHDDGDVVADPRPRFTGRAAHIVNVARLTTVKNQQLLIRLMDRLLKDGQAWTLTLVGEGPHRASLEGEVERRGLENVVRFAGRVGHGEELWRLLDEADVFVLPSRAEGTPKVLLEAMARGLPVVASKVGGVPSIVTHGENGLLVDDDDLDDVERAVRAVRDDAALRARCVSGGLAKARAHTVTAETDRIIAAVKERWPGLWASERKDQGERSR